MFERSSRVCWSGVAATLCFAYAFPACALAQPAPSDFSAAQMPDLGEPSAEMAPSPAVVRLVRMNSDMTVARLCSNPRAKAVLDTDLPGLTTRPEYPFFKNMSLKRIKAMSGGRMTDADLARVDAGLAALEAPPPPVVDK